MTISSLADGTHRTGNGISRIAVATDSWCPSASLRRKLEGRRPAPRFPPGQFRARHSPGPGGLSARGEPFPRQERAPSGDFFGIPMSGVLARIGRHAPGEPGQRQPANSAGTPFGGSHASQDRKGSPLAPERRHHAVPPTRGRPTGRARRQTGQSPPRAAIATELCHRPDRRVWHRGPDGATRQPMHAGRPHRRGSRPMVPD